MKTSTRSVHEPGCKAEPALMKSMIRSRSRKKTAVFAAQIPFAVLCAFAAPRIGILDLGLDAGSVKGAFGCPSNPRAIAETLSPIGEVFPVAGEDVSKKDDVDPDYDGYYENVKPIDFDKMRDNSAVIKTIITAVVFFGLASAVFYMLITFFMQ